MSLNNEWLLEFQPDLGVEPNNPVFAQDKWALAFFWDS